MAIGGDIMVKRIPCTVVHSVPINRLADPPRIGRRFEYDDPRCDLNAGRFAVSDESGPVIYTACARVRERLGQSGGLPQVDIRA